MKLIGKYQVIEQLGDSAAGATYRVRDNFRNREFALKVLKTVPGLTSAAKEQFCDYLARCAELVHRNLVKVQDLGEVEEGIFVVSEWRTGMDLDRFMRENRDLPLGQKLALVAQVAEGLAFAHSREIAHGDLKPSNVFVDGERDITILDFGIARWLAARLDAGSRPEELVANYLAPEQVLGQPFDARSDIFALGLMLYQFISGKYPFAAPAGLIPREIVHANVESLRNLDPQIPQQLAALVERALLKDPAARLRTAEEFAAGLYLAAQELRRQASAAAPDVAAPVGSLALETPPPVPATPTPVVRQTPQSAPEQPVRQRPQDVLAVPQPWTARSFAAGAPLTKEPLREQAQAEPPQPPAPQQPLAPAPAATPIPAQAAPAPMARVPEVTPRPDLSAQNPIAAFRELPAKPPLATAAPLVTRRTVTVLAGLVLAAGIVGSFVSRRGLQASPNKDLVPPVAAQPRPHAVASDSPPAVPQKPEAATTDEPDADDLGNAELAARETLRGPVRTLWESGRYAEALALVNHVLATNPNDAEARAWKKKVRDAQKAEAALK